MKPYEGEAFKLKSHGAQNLGKNDYLKDVQCIEILRKCLPNYKKGFAILLTNDPTFWYNSSKTNTGCQELKLAETWLRLAR
jgi:hypothetical protein